MKTTQINNMKSIISLLVFCVFVVSAKAGVGNNDKNHDGSGVEDPTPASKLTVGKVISSRSYDKKKYVFKGSVTDIKTNLPVKGAKVSMKGTDVSVVTDAYGLYLFNIPEELVKDNMFFEINYPGYERKSFFINKDFLPLLEQSVDGQIKRFMLK